jgi:single-stranded DNA-binding protein
MVALLQGCGELSRRSDDGQWISDTKWVKVAQWFSNVDTAHKAAGHIRRGALVLVQGRLEEPEVWVGKDGKPHASLRVTIREFASVLRPPKDGASPAADGDDGGDYDGDVPF